MARRARSTRPSAAPRRRRTIAWRWRPATSKTVRLRLTSTAPDRARAKKTTPFAEGFERHFQARRAEADEFYRRDHPEAPQRRSGHRDAPGVGRHAVEQAVLLLRRGQMARGARRQSLQAEPAAGAAQRPMAPHVQCRRHLDAGQMGISLVRRLGPRLPGAGPHPGGRGFRQAAAGPDAAGALSPSQRPDPGL